MMIFELISATVGSRSRSCTDHEWIWKIKCILKGVCYFCKTCLSIYLFMQCRGFLLLPYDVHAQSILCQSIYDNLLTCSVSAYFVKVYIFSHLLSQSILCQKILFQSILAQIILNQSILCQSKLAHLLSILYQKE